MNKVILIGRIGKMIPSTTKKGIPTCTIMLATDKKFNNEKVTAWHTVNTYNSVADIATKYCGVGDLLGVEGEVAYNTFTDKNHGHEVTKCIILTHKLSLLGSKKKEIAPETNYNRDPAENLWEGGQDKIPF